MSEEKELVKKRGSFIGRLAAFKNYLDALDDKKLRSNDITELQLRLEKLESLYEEYDEVQLRLECIADDIKTQFFQRTEFETLYYKSLSRSQNILSEYNNQSIKGDKCTRANNDMSVKLPNIQLPKFSGSPSNWLEFRNTFFSLIHCNDGIDEINKFHYLRASLEGAAAAVVTSLEFTSSNYAVAWKLLCERFDNKRLLIQNHVSALFNIEAITSESSIALKGLIDQLNINLRALSSLGEPVTKWNTLLIYIFTRKLDKKTYRKWEEFKVSIKDDSEITMDTFISFIRSHADLVETIELSHDTTSCDDNKVNLSATITAPFSHVKQCCVLACEPF